MKINKILFVSCVAAVLFAVASLTGCVRKTDMVFEEELSDSGIEDAKNGSVTETPADNLSAQEPSLEVSPTPQPQQIFVDVCGAVCHPGVIELTAEAGCLRRFRLWAECCRKLPLDM